MWQKIQQIMQTTLQQKNSSMMLTGGRTAEALYQALRENRVLEQFPQTNFYIGDERCLPLEHPESNSRMIIKTLFSGKSPSGFKPIDGGTKKPTEEAVRYAKQLPDTIDLLLLSVGEDGHIASLFPNSELLNLQNRLDQKVTYINNASKLPSNRITITPRVIENAKEIVVMVTGRKKGKIVAKALTQPDNIKELPVRMTIGKTWLLDPQAMVEFNKQSPENYYNTKIEPC